MKYLSIILITLVALFIAIPGMAEEGRYQAVSISNDGNEKVFILDTKEGYCWTWLPPNDSRISSIIKYEGQVKVGKKPGEFMTGPVTNKPQEP